MHRFEEVSTVFIFLISYLLKSSLSKSVICPSDFAKGIPFEIYGGPLFPVAIFREDSQTFLTPFWAEISGYHSRHLVRSLQDSDFKVCLHEENSKCESAFRSISERVLRDVLWTSRLREGVDLLREFKIDSWGDVTLDDYHTVLRRRTILVMCLHWCHGMLELPEEERPMMKLLCPDPCKQPGVCMSPLDVRGSCHLTGEGFFQHQYACNCTDGGLWNAAIETCTRDIDPCDNKESPRCFPKGTELCSYDRESEEVTCLCKPHYMGENCSIPADACHDHIRNPLLPNGGLPVIGNQACNVNSDGNQCIASLDPDLGPTYTCVCMENRWTGDVTLSYDNCLKKVTSCDKTICINGKCVDSPDGSEASQSISFKNVTLKIGGKGRQYVYISSFVNNMGLV